MTSSSATSPLLERIRRLGKCPPSLLRWNAMNNFDDKVMGMLEMDGISLRSEPQVATTFDSIIKMAMSTESIPGSLDMKLKSTILIQRRAIILAILGSTPSNNIALKSVLANGALVMIKSWLDDILSKSVGGVDLLLHLLSSITHLPVTKEMVADSKLGKAVVTVGSHKICAGAPNENVIRERISLFKDAWSASVKQQLKSKKDDDGSYSSNYKRPSESVLNEGNKKQRVDVSNHLTTSNLLRNVETIPHKAVDTPKASKPEQEGPKKRQGKSISWAEDKLIVYHDEKGRDKDTMRSKSKPGDKQSKLDAMINANPSLVPWRKPQPLKNINAAQVTSNELAKQVSRMASVVPAEFASEDDVPSSPTPLNDIEQALDMTSQASSTPETIPFFAPQQEKEVVAPAPAPVIPIPAQQPLAPANISTLVPPPPPPRAATTGMQGATLELVQALGLPLFLVGQNIQALQTLAATPNLLHTFIDGNGMFDQVRLLNLVQTLSQNLAPAQPVPQTQPVAQTPVNIAQNPYPNQQFQQNPMITPSAPNFPPQLTAYTPQSTVYGNSNNRTQQGYGRKLNGSGAGYRGDQNGSDTNLHISGYGPTTTQADIMTLFTPYVHVVEVVTKNGFSFVNTRDPAGAKRAREALNGAILGGRPIRINIATRRAPDPAHMGGDSYGRKSYHQQVHVPVPLPRNALGQVDYDQVRDDRGNPATKNLFVAGYGPGTNEQELRLLFSQHAQVSGAVMKGSFAFINTTDKVTAVQAREALIGTPLNGGILRINFAKESGRLGTSFDQTYGPASRSPYMRDR